MLCVVWCISECNRANAFDRQIYEKYANDQMYLTFWSYPTESVVYVRTHSMRGESCWTCFPESVLLFHRVQHCSHCTYMDLWLNNKYPKSRVWMVSMQVVYSMAWRKVVELEVYVICCARSRSGAACIRLWPRGNWLRRTRCHIHKMILKQ